MYTISIYLTRMLLCVLLYSECELPCSSRGKASHDGIQPESTSGDCYGAGNDRPDMKSFRYVLDPLCLSACFLYAANRWLIEPICSWPFLHEHFDDLLLIPAALPLVLGIQRWTRLRNHDLPPTALEIFGHLLIWSTVCEGLGPLIFPWAVGDVLDVAAYALGALAAGIWWNHRVLVSWLTGTPCGPLQLRASITWRSRVLGSRNLVKNSILGRRPRFSTFRVVLIRTLFPVTPNDPNSRGASKGRGYRLGC
jgi:hypothetical protein